MHKPAPPPRELLMSLYHCTSQLAILGNTTSAQVASTLRLYFKKCVSVEVALKRNKLIQIIP